MWYLILFGFLSLGDMNYQVREATSRDLAARMPYTREELEASATDNNPEIRYRANRILNAYFDLSMYDIPSIWSLPTHLRHPNGPPDGDIEKDISSKYHREVSEAKPVHFNGHITPDMQLQFNDAQAMENYLYDQMDKGIFTRQQAIDLIKQLKR